MVLEAKLIVKILMEICFLNFGLAAGKYFTNLKKKKQTAIIAKIPDFQGMHLSQL